jgi:V/A-type H+-transporting ATPase subunit I
MALRPESAHWFDCLIARDDLTVTVETLANSGQIQLETRVMEEESGTLTDLSALLEEFHQLASRYHLYWPQAVAPSTVTGKPARILHRALQQLRHWAEQADTPIRELERLQAESTDLLHLREWLQTLQTTLETGSTLDIGELFNTGPLLTTLLYRIAAQAELPPLPPRWFAWEIAQQLDRDVLLIGPAADAAQLAHDFSAHRVRRIPLPTWLHGSARAAASQIDARLQIYAKRKEELQRLLEAAHHEFGLTEALGEIARLDWFLRHVRYQSSGANLAWIRGWSSAPDADQLQESLANAGVRALVQFSMPPKDLKAPLVLRNPRWARAFELFPRLLGMPSATETDPSRMLALLVPLLFGYMFGDLGQGFVILLAGLLLRRKWPQAVLLVPAGASSMIFGVLFGSLFAREDLIPALWLHPVTEPLKVLGLPIAGGILLLLLGLLLNGIQAGWRREGRHWAWREAPVILIYVSIIAMFITPGAKYALMIGLGWSLLGVLVVGTGNVAVRIGLAAAELFEQLFQLAVNTLSFARVGAFALAHAGLSQAIVSLADVAGHGGWLVMLLGNLFIIALEGLVVFIQTTRLVLFEFFIRFLRGEGQGFTPLPAPDYFAFTDTRSQS